MPIKFHCPSCSQRLSVSRKKAGRQSKCPKCGETITIPTLERVVKVKPQEDAAEADREAPPPEVAPLSSLGAAPPVAEPPQSAPAKYWEEESEPGDGEDHFGEFTAGTDSGDTEPPPPPTPRQARGRGKDDDEPVFSVRKPETEFEEMDLTPMVDVTFLLLIFFMLTASFSLQKTIPTPVPEQNEQSASQPIQPQEDLLEKSIVIEIDGKNRIFLDEEPVADTRALEDALRSKMNAEKKTEVLVDASAEAFNETVVAVLDAASEAEVQKIRMAFPKGSSGDE